MERREALKYVGLITGGTLISSQLFIIGCKSETETTNGRQIEFLTAGQIELLNEIGEIIIPTSNTPGAKAANVGQLMSTNIRDCYEKDKQDSFLKGLDLIDQRSKSIHNDVFSKINLGNQTNLIKDLDNEVYSSSNKTDDDIHACYRMIKELTLLGYFTSELCLTKHLEYIPVPTKYEGEADYDGNSLMKIFGNGF